MPGRAGAPPSRAAGGRGGRSCCIPCFEENGLLPGRAPPGRGPGRAPPVGRPPAWPGRGAAGAGAAAAGFSATGSGAASGSGVGAAGLRGPGTGPGALGALGVLGTSAAGVSPTGTAFSTASVVVGACSGDSGFLAAAFFAGAFFAGAFAAPIASRRSPCSSRRRRTTGASTVEDADFFARSVQHEMDHLAGKHLIAHSSVEMREAMIENYNILIHKGV